MVEALAVTRPQDVCTTVTKPQRLKPLLSKPQDVCAVAMTLQCEHMVEAPVVTGSQGVCV